MECNFCGKEDFFLNFDNTCCHCGKKNYGFEDRFAELSELGQHEPLTDEQMEEWEKLVELLELKDCDNCKGEGGRDFPSPTGGWDYLICKVCEGHGFLGLSNELKNKLKKI